MCHSVKARTAYRRQLTGLAFGVILLGMISALPGDEASDKTLVLHARRRVVAADNQTVRVVNETIRWDADKTAIVICDMWDQHWCKGATRRVAEMAPRMNEVVSEARRRGVLIIHCPSGCMDQYADTPMRRRAMAAPKVETSIPLQRWCSLDADREGSLPIDDSDGGCDCWPPCKTSHPWTRQIDVIEIDPADAITDSAEAFYLMKERGITNVIVMGVHTNMCVLGRPFSIRQMVYQGQNVVLMRDMTDTMYNSRRPPYVNHTKGTELVIEHIERHWCPTITSTDFTGKPPFRFREADQPHVVFMIGEREYDTKETLPRFAEQQLVPRNVRFTIIHADEEDKNNFPGLLALKTADLLFISVRRRSLPDEQLKLVREYVEAGKPVMGIRTASHAFHTKGTHPEGHGEWQSFDPHVLGGNYQGHHGAGPPVKLQPAPRAEGHPILNDVDATKFVSYGSLYRVSPLASTAQALLIGTIPGKPPEPVAWTHMYRGGRVFYCSLGHPKDFEQDDFKRLLVNAVFWCLNRPVPASTSSDTGE